MIRVEQEIARIIEVLGHPHFEINNLIILLIEIYQGYLKLNSFTFKKLIQIYTLFCLKIKL
jgi:hypothetical protein